MSLLRLNRVIKLSQTVYRQCDQYHTEFVGRTVTQNIKDNTFDYIKNNQR